MKRVHGRLSNIVARGRRALALVAQTSFEPKLPEGLADALERDIADLSSLIPGADDAETGVRARTARQKDVCRRAHRRIAAVRRTIVRQTKDLEARRAYGVGEQISERVVRDMVHALRLIIGRIEAQPAEARSFGFRDSHLGALRTMLADVLAADLDQESARVALPRSTRDRNAAAGRILKAVGIVSDFGAFEFADDDARRAEFEALASHAGRPAKDRTEPGDAARPSPAPETAPA